jgi:two-component system sensor histidine kinase CpxA
VNSLFAKILLWFLATMLVVLLMFVVTTAILLSDDEDRMPPFAMLVNVEFSEARQAFETGGVDALAAALHRFSTATPYPGVATDANGRDLVSGADRSDLLHYSNRRPATFFGGRRILSRRSEDGTFLYFLEIPRRRTLFWFLRWQHLWILGLISLLCYALARNLAAPVRQLQAAVDRFGRGDLKARASSRRGDELGQLAKTFNQMADRIATLLAAERRLLLDVSHELRSPLARLNVALELARTGSNPESALDRIEKESERLNSLVGELVTVTRAEGDPAALRCQPVPLNELVSDVVNDSKLEATARGCRVLLHPPPAVVIDADPELVRRAVENVIRNAIRYAPPEKAVEVSIEDGACVVVRDYGPGVPPESLPRLFDAF